jgi:TusA-related sulfurtransferase
VSGKKEPNPDVSIDTVGLFCPVPIFKTREALETMEKGQVLEVLADDPAAESDFQSLRSGLDYKLLKLEKDDEGTLRFLIEKTK